MASRRGADERLVAGLSGSLRAHFGHHWNPQKSGHPIGSGQLRDCLKQGKTENVFSKLVLRNNFSARIKHLVMAFDGKHHLTNLYENSLRADKKSRHVVIETQKIVIAKN